MRHVGAFEAKTHFSSLLEQVEQGEQITITKHGRPVARIIPLQPSTQNASRVIARIQALSEGITLDGLDWKMLRDEGRL